VKFIKETKGQGALEYLLIIGGAIMIAAVVIAIIVKVGGSGKTAADGASTDINSLYTQGQGMIEMPEE